MTEVEDNLIRYTNVDTITPGELEQRRRDIVQSLTHTYQGYDDPNVPLPLLRELAFITQTLRRKNAGPPRTKRSASRPKFTPDDI